MERSIKCRAFVYIDYYDRILNEPKGTGSTVVSKYCMCEVLQLNISTGNMRVRYKKSGTIDVPIQNLMQYVGLKDKNLKLAFVGDIFKETLNNGEERFYKIFNIKGGFGINIHQDDFKKDPEKIVFYESLGDQQAASWFESSLVKIGNVFENPELLK